MIIQFRAKFKCGDLCFNRGNDRLRVVSLRYDLTPHSQDVYYYTRNIVSNVYAWYTGDNLQSVSEVSRPSECFDLPF